MKKSYSENRRILRNYIKLIKNNQIYKSAWKKDEEDGYVSNTYNIWITYFIILHNWLHFEEEFETEIKLNKKEINIHLDLNENADFSEIIETAHFLYSVLSPVRFAIETLDSIEEVRLKKESILKNQIDLYNKILFTI